MSMNSQTVNDLIEDLIQSFQALSTEAAGENNSDLHNVRMQQLGE